MVRPSTPHGERQWLEAILNLAIGSVVLFQGTTSAAQERPTMGDPVQHHGRSLPHLRMSFGCIRAGMFIRANGRAAEGQARGAPQVLQKARTDYLEFKRDAVKQCQGVEAMHEALVLGRAPPGSDLRKFSEANALMHPGQRAELVKMVEAMRDMCRTPTEAKFVEFTRVNHDKDSRTCRSALIPINSDLGAWTWLAPGSLSIGRVDHAGQSTSADFREIRRAG